MVGGERQALDKAQPVLLAMGDRVFHVGPNGAGSAMKVIVNLMIGMTVLTVAETLTLGQKAGPRPASNARDTRANGGQLAAPQEQRQGDGRAPVRAAAFALKYMQKDFDLIMEAAHDLKTPLFTSAIAHQVYTAANVAGYGELDYAAVIKFLQEAAAIRIEEP